MMSTRESSPDPVSLWWVILLFGVATFAVGLFFVISPHETLKVFTVVAGIFLLVDGVLAVIGAIVGVSDSRGLLAMLGVLSAIAGLVLIKKPFNTLVVFTLIVGVWFVVAGGVRLISAFALEGGRAAYILGGIVDLIAGIVILSWPELGLATFAVIVGIVLMLRGILFVYAGWLLHSLHDGGSGEPRATALA